MKNIAKKLLNCFIKANREARVGSNSDLNSPALSINKNGAIGDNLLGVRSDN